jgi:hypothetical protein
MGLSPSSRIHVDAATTFSFYFFAHAFLSKNGNEKTTVKSRKDIVFEKTKNFSMPSKPKEIFSPIGTRLYNKKKNA